MPASVLLAPGLLQQDEVTLEGDVFHHLVRVRRLEAGETLQVVDGEGHCRAARLGEINKKSARLVLLEKLPARDPERRLHLLVGALRPERASWLVEKATELGVFALRFLQTERTPRQYSQGRFERYDKVAAAALEQCLGARLPQITGVHPFAEIAKLLPQSAPAYVLDPLASEGLLSSALPPATEVAVLIGPEGGFSPAELEALRGLGVRGAGLGQRILRVESAAIAAAALMLASGP